MKTNLKMMVMATVLASLPLAARGQSIYPLPAETKADIGANYLAVIKYSDLAASTSTNTALVLTNFAVAAKTQVEVVLAKLVTAFTTGNTNFTGSVALTVGDGTDADLFLTSTELASDGTEVWLKSGAREVQTLALTTASVAATNGTFACVTNVSLSAVSGRKVYTAADTVDFTFTPNAEEALSANTNGEVWIYLKVITP